VSARQLLDQLLQAGQSLGQGAARQGGTQTPQRAEPGQGGLASVLSGLGAGGQGGLSSLLSGLGGGKGVNGSPMLGSLGAGALGAGALGLLMGSKKARKIGGKVAMYGGMAALGALAFRAYQDWQSRQPGQGAGAPEPQTMDRLPPAQAEQHSRAVLAAMIGAAKADGHIGDSERALLEEALAKLSGDAQDRAWLEAELARPLDPAQVAAQAQTPEMAAEMYLASMMVIDEDSFMERAYLDELARRLNLTADLKATLENQVRAA